MRVLTRFTTADIEPEDAVSLEYEDNPDGGDPVFCRAILIKGGAALRDERGQLPVLVLDSPNRQYDPLALPSLE